VGHGILSDRVDLVGIL